MEFDHFKIEQEKDKTCTEIREFLKIGSIVESEDGTLPFWRKDAEQFFI